jgi:hypothetical protein
LGGAQISYPPPASQNPGPTSHMRRGTGLLWLALVVVALTLLLVRPQQRSQPVPIADPVALLRRQRIAARTTAAAAEAAAASVLQREPPAPAEVAPPDVVAAAASVASAATTAGSEHMGEGQCEHARVSVKTAVEKQRAPADMESLQTSNTQTSYAQAERESDNVRRLLQANGMPSWRPDLRKLPPQRPANASMEQLLEHVPVGGHAWLAFGNSGVTEMLFNWCHHVIGLGMGWQLVVAAFDVPLLHALREMRVPAYNYSGALPATHFRHAPHLFHRMPAG